MCAEVINEMWDLESLYNSNEEWERELKTIYVSISQFNSLKEMINGFPENLYDVIIMKEKVEIAFDNLYAYAYLKTKENNSDELCRSMLDRTYSLAGELYYLFSEIDKKIIELENFESLMNKNPKLLPYVSYYNKIIENKNHSRSSEVEEILNNSLETLESSRTIYSTMTNIEFGPFVVKDSKNNSIEISANDYFVLLTNEDRILREGVFRKVIGEYKKYSNTLTALLEASIKSDVFIAKSRNYESSLEMALSFDSISVSIFNNLINNVEKNLTRLHSLISFRKKYLKLDKLHWYDLFHSIGEEPKLNLAFLGSKEIILNSLSPLGDRYNKVLLNAYCEKWISPYPEKNKDPGAFSFGTYTSKPFIFLNYKGTLDDLFTLTHELGHSVHTYLTNKSQPYLFSNYSSFLGEIVALVNELLLMEYLLKQNSLDKGTRVFLLNYSLELFRGKLFRQTMYSTFEKSLHSMIEDNKTLNTLEVKDIFKNLLTSYFGPDLYIDEEIKFEFLRVPHLFNSFYMYKYSVGFVAAISIVEQIISNNSEFISRYIQLLSSGSSQEPILLLQNLGVNLETEEPYIKAFEVFDNRLNELNKMEINK